MKEKLYYKEVNDKTLVLDSVTGLIGWEDGSDFLQVQMRNLQRLILNKEDNFLRAASNEIVILEVTPYSKLTLKVINGKSYLVSLNKTLGLLKCDLQDKELENLNRNGGLIIVLLESTEKNIVFIIPNLKKYEKNTISLGRNIFKGNENNHYFNNYNISNNSVLDDEEDYIETNLKLPKKLFNSNQEVLELLNKNHLLMREHYYELNSKLTHLNNTVKSLSDNSEKDYIIKKQELNIKDLNYQLEKLIHDRRQLENERKKAELIALNQFKADLKMSTLAIEKQVDLDDSYSLHSKLQSLVTDILDFLEVPQEAKNKVMESKSINAKITDISDNFDSKVQSLMDIRDEFVLNNIIKPKGD